MRYRLLLAATPALAATAPQQPPPLVQACAQAATEQLQQAMVWHARVIGQAAQIAALKAQIAKMTPKGKPVGP